MPKELEIILRCPQCDAEKARVYRTEASSEGVWVNKTEPENMTGVKACPECETTLVGQR